MSNKGWLPISREMMDSPIFNVKPFDRFHALVDLHRRARYVSGVIECKGHPVTLHPGQLICAQRSLADSWGWDKNTVTRYLKRLEDGGYIRRKMVYGVSVITLCKEVKELNNNYTNSDTDADKHADTKAYTHADHTNKGNKVKKKKASRAREDFFSKFCSLIDQEALLNLWNSLNLKHLEHIVDSCFIDIFQAYLRRIKIDFPDSPSIDEVTSEEWRAFINKNVTKLPEVNEWLSYYVQDGFACFIGDFHRGKNATNWVADIFYAFKLKTLDEVKAQTGIY
ncbi:helix-turn-helix transcriptional regulator [Vibrio alginolyticus]|uniref:helix-turn-helix transcriptional regulator n=1 Tax=Vibrio alginolyticus TaxID=663 RepID=UPI0007204914|nr:replication/maintenance protein RepL [Vibrio alginolyticus]ALR91704.1 hypothetical protein AT730_04585 [Vibrio alginolyticus]MBY7710545.1 replication/maintenance protein RepL [Vibrio alginolyticus]